MTSHFVKEGVVLDDSYKVFQEIKHIEVEESQRSNMGAILVHQIG